MPRKILFLSLFFTAALLVAVAGLFHFQQQTRAARTELDAVRSTQRALDSLISTQQRQLTYMRLKSEGDDLFMNNNYAEAFARYRDAQALNPDSADTTDLLARRQDMRDSVLSFRARLASGQRQRTELEKHLEAQEASLRTLSRLSAAKEQMLADEVSLMQSNLQLMSDSAMFYSGEYRRLLRDQELLSFQNVKGSQIRYIGDTQENRANGVGIGLWPTGGIYRGQWQDNQRHGKGRYEWADGEWYEGDFKQDRRHGRGTYVWKNGNRYEGEWKADQRHGEGVLYDAEGTVAQQGLWQEDNFVGRTSSLRP